MLAMRIFMVEKIISYLKHMRYEINYNNYY